MERKPTADHPSQKRKQYRIFDLITKHSIGEISTKEFKRCSTLIQLNGMCYASGKSFLPSFYHGHSQHISSNFFQDDIFGMEVHPREGRRLLVISKYCNVSLLDVSKMDNDFKQLKRQIIKHPHGVNNVVPNAAHWLWDGSMFTVSTRNDLYFWDSERFQIFESIRIDTNVLNHVVVARDDNISKYVAVAGSDGNLLIVDMLVGGVTKTKNNIEKSPIRAIRWRPLHEFNYATGNNNGNMFLWDTRFEKKPIFKFRQDSSFSKSTSHSHPIIGLRFYSNGSKIISVDSQGGIKTWEVNSGRFLPNHYEPISLSNHNKNDFKDYQFDVTVNLKEDIVFLPSTKGMRMFDIESGEHLPNSSDVCVPMNCATYDPKRMRVYSGHYDVVKLWSTEFIRSDDLT